MKFLHNRTDRQYFVDMDLQLKMELKIFKVRLKIDGIMEGSNNRLTYFDQTIDCCNILKHVPVNWELKTLLGDYLNYKNVPKTCPIQPGYYFLHNHTIQFKYLPMKIIPKMKFFTSSEYFTIIKKRKIIFSIVRVDSELRYNNL